MEPDSLIFLTLITTLQWCRPFWGGPWQLSMGWQSTTILVVVVNQFVYLLALCYSGAHAGTHVTTQDLQYEPQR